MPYVWLYCRLIMIKLKEILLKWLKLDGLINSLTGYAEARMELLKYEIREEVSAAMARFVVLLAVFALLALALLTASVAFSLKLGESYGYAVGFSITAGIYATVLLGLLLFRNKLYRYLERFIKIQMTQKK